MLTESLLKNRVLEEVNSKNVVSPMQKKQAEAHVVGRGLCSVRRACCYLDVHRSTYRYQAKPVPSRQRQLHQRIVALSWHHPRYGY